MLPSIIVENILIHNVPRQEVLDSQWFLAIIYSTRAIEDTDRLLKSSKDFNVYSLNSHQCGIRLWKKECLANHEKWSFGEGMQIVYFASQDRFLQLACLLNAKIET